MTSQPKRNLEAFFSGEEWVLKKTFIRGGSAPVGDLGDRGARGPGSPLFLHQTEAFPLSLDDPPPPPPPPLVNVWIRRHCFYIQLFRERLSEKVQATIPKGILGGFGFAVLSRNLKELARKAMKMCLCVLTESNKTRFDSYSLPEKCIEHIPYYLSGLSRAHFFRPFSK